jgi:pyridoxal 5-phosphate dependent beta-lyase
VTSRSPSLPRPADLARSGEEREARSADAYGRGVTTALPHEDLAASWRAARGTPAVRHLDSAACSRTSLAVQEAVSRHAALEAEIGGYQAEAAAAPLLDAARDAIAELTGMPRSDDGTRSVAFTESAVASLEALLGAWQFPAGGRVFLGQGEYGPGVPLFRRHGLDAVAVAPDELSDAIRREPPVLVHLTHLASYRGFTQPAAEVSAACSETGVPLWLDAAQSLGHLDCALGAAAVYATSRKWLAGPRGVGILAVSPAWRHALVGRPAAPGYADVPLSVESSEAHIAGRVGLAAALREHLAAGPERVRERLAAVGQLGRSALDGARGWTVADTNGDRSALVTLAPPPGADVGATREYLLREHAILTTAAGAERAPLDPAATHTLLRVSGHVDASTDDFAALARALEEGTAPRRGTPVP